MYEHKKILIVIICLGYLFVIKYMFMYFNRNYVELQFFFLRNS